MNSFLSNRIYRALNGEKNGRHWETLVGYTVIDLKQHLESKFQEGMTWQNYGQFGWHIDHIKAKSHFVYTSAEEIQFKECWALKNLQPLWWYDNLSKSDKTLDEYFIDNLINQSYSEASDPIE